MSRFYTSIDIGTYTVKMLVGKIENNTTKLIAHTEKKSFGVKKGIITDVSKVVETVTACKKQIEKQIGIRLKKIILCIPSDDCIFDIVSGQVNTIDENNIRGEDINNVLQVAIKNNIKIGYELVTAIPIAFKLSNNQTVKDPKGLQSKTLDAKIVITEIPRKDLYNVLNVLELSELEVVDIVLKTISDYYEIKNDQRDSEVGCIINIGEDTTNVSIYNKGIMIKTTNIKVGSYYVDYDFSYIYKTKIEDSRKLKENFALASTRYADKYDEIEIKNDQGVKKIINQYEISQIAEARIAEILKISKKAIKNLTNRQISYIIIVGGLSEMNGFQYIAESIFGSKVTVWNSTTLGIRHNKYTSVLGAIKYFNDKLMLRDRKYKMFSTEDIDKLISIRSDAAINELFVDFIKD